MRLAVGVTAELELELDLVRIGKVRVPETLKLGAGSQFDEECVTALFRALDRRDSTAEVVALRPPGLQ